MHTCGHTWPECSLSTRSLMSWLLFSCTETPKQRNLQSKDSSLAQEPWAGMAAGRATGLPCNGSPDPSEPRIRTRPAELTHPMQRALSSLDPTGPQRCSGSSSSSWRLDCGQQCRAPTLPHSWLGHLARLHSESQGSELWCGDGMGRLCPVACQVQRLVLCGAWQGHVSCRATVPHAKVRAAQQV